jgi:SulP family sulfate permease
VRERISPSKHTSLVLDFGRVPFMDVSAVRAVETIAQDAAHAGKHLYVCGINRAVAANFEGLGAGDHLPTKIRFENRLDALTAARDWIFENTASLDDKQVNSQSGNPAAA